MTLLQYAGLCFMPYILITGELMTVPTALFADDCLRFIQLTKYSLEPRVVFQIWRPVINESLMKHWFPKTGTKVCTRYACVFRVFCFARFVLAGVVVFCSVMACVGLAFLVIDVVISARTVCVSQIIEHITYPRF